ncbi:Stk1 family PASTA domain-containing Ser/Thr kinase [Clostridium sp. CF011]|uniref:Stk1 family PASTA domain-containing Ser/Thr kinase n=1 Tax=Clostridium sp. CF011 TaxID=2843318 RepID=UPI001C0D2B90|nr:Stk1 family PASTA domain-containing Ser/Thr kinase [Clostridium sp. CF011]MBU3092119.1 Stk1 family PASTA domain-containing Ser/Thr kinase [Clostridium sp. CF011]WAG71040.1 Stk1 family PASTA domain-containing Ser/Thr kinase [Clostridium sp. CF011]
MIGKLLLNRYELLEKIGEGGMGTVYKAKCHLLNRFVAVKILKAELSNDEEFVSRFKREATSIARLSHPNIVNVHDVGAENHINFIVMEYINGKTLKQLIKKNARFTSQRTLDISLQIAKALQCAHINNIIHRDIKPDNIMIAEDNIVKVMDFGIAKVTDSITVTNSNKVMGTVHYFSPEQAKGNFIDCRTDIYSLGIVMYEMITGQVPYNAESAISIAMMHIHEPATAPKEIITDIPENINQVILKAMQKEPFKRYQTAKDMADIINAIKEDSNYEVKVNNDLDDATNIMGATIFSDIKDNFTTVMSGASIAEKAANKKDNEVITGNEKTVNNKKAVIIIASIILVVIASILGKFISNGTSINTPAPIVETTVPKANEKLQSDEIQHVDKKQQADEQLSVVEIKFVPSLIGRTQDIANQTVVNNGFMLGNISNEYSDSIAQGLVISQSPEVNTSYEKDGKVDLVISQGKKIEQVTVPQLNGKTLDDAKEILDNIQLELGEKTPINMDDKARKGNHSKNNNKKIFMQNAEAGTLVDIGTKINVSYYGSKKDLSK